ncbi:MAG: hypothetical protein WC121_03685 [Candidatus Kapaibacterium sp.]
MNNLTNNDFELITQLLDGELSSEQAAEVTKMIESSPEMQAEMDRLSEISNAIREDDEEFVPPKKAKDNVFLALGIPLAVSAPSLTSMSSEIANLISIGAAFTASLLTFTMFYSLNDVDSSNVASNSNVPIVSSYEKAKDNNIIIEDEPIALEVVEDLSNSTNNSPIISPSNSIANRTTGYNNSVNTSSSSANANNDLSLNNNTVAIERTNNVSDNSSIIENINENKTPNTIDKRDLVSAWEANIITSRKTGIQTNNSIFLEGNALTSNGLTYTRDYLTIIRTKATSNNLNSGQFDISFLTNYFATDVRGIISAGLSWYDQNSNPDLRSPVFVGGGIEYTPTFTSLLANGYFDSFINGQLFLGSNPSYKMEVGISTTLGGVTNFPIVIGYTRNYVRDYQFIRQELNDGLFIGTEISF